MKNDKVPVFYAIFDKEIYCLKKSNFVKNVSHIGDIASYDIPFMDECP